MLRFFENTAKSVGQGSTVQLVGTKSNRDAIGARATITLTSGRKLARTLHAGSGYLSQSSKRLHFAWEANDVPVKLEIHWPSGTHSSYPWYHASSRLTVTEGDRKVDAITPTARISFQDATSTLDRRPSRRLVSFSKPWFPDQKLFTTSLRTRPLLVQLWAPWCAACLAERKEFSDARKKMTSANIDVVAVSIDADTKARYPYPEVASTPEFLDTLEVFQRALLDRQEPLRLPLSFLLDGGGQLTSYYSGRVTPEQVIADSKPTKDRLEAALPFEGDWLNPPVPTEPLNIALQFLASGKRSDALAYLNQLTAKLRANHPDTATWNAANLQAFRGSLMKGSARELAYQAALTADATHFESLKQLGLIHLGKRDAKQAAPLITKALAQQPTDPVLLFAQAQLQFATNKLPSAIDTLRRLVTAHPTHWLATNNLAWLLATHASAELRNGQEALQLALRLPLEQEVNYADALAAAYAELGKFDEAQRVIAEAMGKADAEQRKNLQLRAKAYAEKKPWRS
jgi:tetratricopeptide (TPR) repeat protein